MSIWPENNCLMCDMPWKNNRVVYEGCPSCTQDVGSDIALCLMIGNLLVRVGKDGVVTGDSLDEPQRIFSYETGREVQCGTMAADVLTKTLYFSAGYEVLALDMENGEIKWSYEMSGFAASPMLYEISQAGEVQTLLCVGDSSGKIASIQRESGTTCWQSETGFPVSDVAAYKDLRLFICCTKVIACLDAASGDTIWFQNANAEKGALHGDVYIAGGKGYLMSDGSRVF